ncbi:hypothetical protein C1N51_28555 (plasmid) [Vibrio campbellii]|nr:hypothetical protein C1N51_28555 [Vibrio campbellii]
MGGISVWQLLILVIIFSVTILPWLMALFSKKTEGKDKFLWFLSSFFLSWLGYLTFYYLCIKKSQN